MHSLLGLHCTKNRKRVPSDIASVSRRIGFKILLFILFILIFFLFLVLFLFAGFFSSGSHFYVF